MSRARRLWRGLLLGIAGLTILVLVAAVALRLYGSVRLRQAERDFLREVGPIECAAYAPPRVAEGRNASPLLLGGAQAIVLVKEEKASLARAFKTHGAESWSAEDQDALRTVLARNAAALEVLRQARHYPDANLGIRYASGLGAELPNLLQAMDAAKVLSADIALSLMDHDFVRVADDVEAMGFQARAYMSEPVLIVTLVGTAIERYQLHAVSLVASSPGVDASTLTRVRRSLQTTDLTAACRRALAYDSVSTRQWFLDPAAQRRPSAEIPIPLSTPERLALAVLRPIGAAESLDSKRVLLGAISGTKGQIDAAVAALQDRRSLLFGELFVVPNIVSVFLRALGNESQRRLAAAALDLRLEALRAGCYPDALPQEHVAPEPLLGVSLRYARALDGSAVLEVPGADGVWKGVAANPWVSSFRWTLPAPAPHD